MSTTSKKTSAKEIEEAIIWQEQHMRNTSLTYAVGLVKGARLVVWRNI